MRASDIKVGNIYNVIFDPVRDCEFNGKHLAVVLKKNNDRSTFIVMPLTSAENGAGVNKVYIGQVDSLPTSLKNNNTYAVFNQVRTVNASRFISLKEGGNVIETTLPKDKLRELLVLAERELVYSIDQDTKISILKEAYEQECVEKAKNLAYNILSLEKNTNGSDEQIAELEHQIKETIKDINYSLDEQYIRDGIEKIFQRVLK